ncbi:MAG TPA: hypothetical protein ENI69_02895 [Rhodospirillales bacterium]|nr:hypothetical protein [Rhodospirillales bacterium]
MGRYCTPANVGNRPYQQQIAISLVHSLGMDDAIDFCVQNGWEETLCVILKDDRHFTDSGNVTLN